MPWFKLRYSITVYTKTLKWCLYEFHVLRLSIEKKKLLREKYQLAIFLAGMRSKLDFFLIWYFSNDPKRLFLVHSGSPCQTGRILWKQLILNYNHSALPKMSGRLNLPYQAYAFFGIVQSAPITMGINFTLVALWILLVSRARSWYLSTISSSVASILWCTGSAMSIRVHSSVSLHTKVISYRLYFSRLSVEKVISQVILTSLFSESGRGWRLYHLSVHSNLYFLHSPIGRK